MDVGQSMLDGSDQIGGFLPEKLDLFDRETYV